MPNNGVKLGDDSVCVLKLKLSGSNWVLYKDRLLWVADAKGYRGHIDGTEMKPVAPSAADEEGSLAAVADAAVERTPTPAQTVHTVALAAWRKGEANVKQLIASTIPDSLFMKIRMQPNVHEIWKALAQEFERKSRMVSVDLRHRLQEQKYYDRDDARLHFAKLRTMRKDLAAMGQSPSKDDFFAIIMGSMPASYEPYLSAISATSRVTGTVLSPDELMEK